MRRRNVGRGAIAILASGLLLASWPAAAAPTDDVIRIATTSTDAAAALVYAQNLGLYQKAGLDVRITVLANGGTVSSAVLGGAFDIGQANVATVIRAHDKGLPFVIVAPASYYTDETATGVCTVAPSATIASAKDLVGQTVAVQGLFDIGQLSLDTWLLQNGVDPAAVKHVELPLPAMGPALLSGRIAAAVLVDPFLQAALSSGQAKVLSKCFSAIAPRFLIGAFVSTSAYARANRPLIARFAAVMADAARWGNAHHAESAKWLAAWSKVPVGPGTTRSVYADRLSAADVQPLIDASARAGAIKAAFPAQDLFAPGEGGP